MPIEEERLIRLRQQRGKQAIDLAMEGRWREAVEVNKEILESFPKDVEAHNRLGRAYMELGEYSQAREAYRQTLELDPYNAIAKKNLQRLSYLKEAASAEEAPSKVEPHHFIEEIGKAGVVSLYQLAPKEVLARVVAGDRVNLKIDGSNLAVESGRGEYLGQVELRHALRLVKLMRGGNKYSSSVVSSNEDSMSIIIREVYQDPSQVGRLSFPPKGLEEVRPYVTDRILKMDSDYGEEVEIEGEGESGYTIIGGEEIEVLPEESDEESGEMDDEV